MTVWKWVLRLQCPKTIQNHNEQNSTAMGRRVWSASSHKKHTTMTAQSHAHEGTHSALFTTQTHTHTHTHTHTYTNTQVAQTRAHLYAHPHAHAYVHAQQNVHAFAHA